MPQKYSDGRELESHGRRHIAESFVTVPDTCVSGKAVAAVAPAMQRSQRVTAVFAKADLIVRHMRATLDWVGGYGRAEYDRGYRDGSERAAADLERAWREFARPMARSLAAAVGLEERRWTLRGEQRTRETFGMPHPRDFLGRGGRTT